MTIAQQLEQKGFKKGFKEGFKKGMEKGIQECMQRCREKGILLDIRSVGHTMLQQGIDYDMVMKVTELSMEELAPLSD